MTDHPTAVQAQLAALDARITGAYTSCEPNQEWIDDRAEARFHPERYEATA